MSSTAKPRGCRISNWVSSIGPINEASPSTYEAIGRPRLPALTYADAKAAITVSLAVRFQTSRASSTHVVADTATPAIEASRLDEKSFATSVSPSTMIISAGLATKNASRASTRWLDSSRIPRRASSMPTPTTTPMVKKPASTPCTPPLARPVGPVGPVA